MALSVCLLGPPRIEVDGTPLEVDTRKAVAILAYLLVTGRRHSRDGLSALLWPEYDQSRARAALRRTLSALNKALGARWLRVDRDVIDIERDGIEVDVDRFRELVVSTSGHGHEPGDACPACVGPLSGAAALYRGEFMSGFALRDAIGFEDWQLATADELRRELGSVLGRLVDARIAAGDLAGGTADARRWLELDALQEAAHRRLMLLYRWTGDRSAALRQYRDCVATLDRELGVPPLEETTELYRAIREERVQPAPEPSPPAPGPPPAGAERQPFVGRSAERALLAEAAGEGRLVVIEGEAGVGKTRLVQEIFGSGMLAAQCHEGESSLAYGPVAELLRTATERAPGAVEAVAGHWLAEAGRLAPDLGSVRPGLPAPAPIDSPGARTRFFEGIAHVLSAAAGDATVFVDDLHWADEASLDVLTYVVRRLGAHPLRLVVTWRTEEIGEDDRLRRLVAQAQRQGRATVVHLERLGPGEVAELVRAAGVPEDLATRLYEETEGLPFFVVEYLASLAAGGPDAAMPAGVRELLGARLAAVSDLGRQVLGAAAAIGRSFDFDTVRESSGRGDDETLIALEELIRRGLVSEVDGRTPRYDFGHERFRRFVYEDMSLARRRLLHRRIADALGRREQRDPALGVAIAEHLRAAGDDAGAADRFRTAGDRARGLYANAEALADYEAALALGHPDAAELHETIGDLHVLGGRYRAALDSYEAAAARGVPDVLGRLEHRLGVLHQRLGEWGASDSYFAAALEAVRDPGLRARVLADRSLTAHRRGDPDAASPFAREALAGAEAAGDTAALAQVHNILGVLARAAGDLEGARRELERSLELASSLHDPTARIAALNNLALAEGAAGEHRRALEHVRTALGVCAMQGDRHREAALHNNLADLLRAAGRTEDAMGHLKQAVTIFAEIGEPDDPRPEIWKLVEW